MQKRTFLGCALTIALCAALRAADDAKPDAKPDAAPPNGDVSAWVDARVEKLQPTADDKRFDEIGWSREVVAAAKLAKEHGRPIFLFTHDGRMNEGRC